MASDLALTMKLRLTWLFTLPVLLLLFFNLLHLTSRMYLYSDEYLVYFQTRFDLQSTILYQATQDVHPPLWFSLFDIWRSLVGDSEFAGRMLSLLLSMLTLALTYRLGRDWFGRVSVGLAAAIFLGLNSYFANFALEIRPYAATMLLDSVSMWLFWRWLRKPTWRAASAYGVGVALMFYVHYFLAFVVAAQGIYFLLFTPKSRQIWKQLVGAAGVGLLVWLPWLPSFINQVLLLRSLSAQSGNAYGSGLGTPATTQATDLATIERLTVLSTNGQVVLYAALLMLGIVFLWRRPAYRLTLFWALGTPTVALVVNLVAAVYTPRYVAYLSVGLALASGAAILALPRIRRIPLSGALLLGCSLLLLAAQPEHISNNVAYRDIFRSMSIREGDAVYLDHAGEGDLPFLRWQMDQYLKSGYTVVADHNLTAVQSLRRLWYITGDWFNAEVEATFAQLEATHPVQQVLGQCDRTWCYLAQLMEAPPLSEPIAFGEQMQFWGADLDRLTDTTLDLRLWWRVDQTPDRDYSIAVHLLNPAGELIAQSDGPIQHYGTEILQTSSLQPGRIYIDHRQLSLPTDRLDGGYSLRLVVYQWWDGVRLAVDGADSYVINTITLQ